MSDFIIALCIGALVYFLGMAIFVLGPEEQKAQILKELRQEQSLSL